MYTAKGDEPIISEYCFFEKNYYISGRVIAHLSASYPKGIFYESDSFFENIVNGYRGFFEKNLLTLYVCEYEKSDMKRKRQNFGVFEITLDIKLLEKGKKRYLSFKIRENDALKSFNVKIRKDNTLVYSKIK